MRVHKGHFERLRRALAASVVALLAAAPALTEAAQPAASGYVPTMADYLGVYAALQNYRFGVEKHDQKALQSAFWKDGEDIAVPSPGMEINMPLDGTPQREVPRRELTYLRVGLGSPGLTLVRRLVGRRQVLHHRLVVGHRPGLRHHLVPMPVRLARERVGGAKSGTCHWTATSTSKVRLEPRTTNTFSVFIRVSSHVPRLTALITPRGRPMIMPTIKARMPI